METIQQESSVELCGNCKEQPSSGPKRCPVIERYDNLMGNHNADKYPCNCCSVCEQVCQRRMP